ncbi:hypothetical protein BJV74DRAFT_767551 [Russula compacta]|nr:hypothetical protein BJV74DRAFT_767551 [Russula compacta]
MRHNRFFFDDGNVTFLVEDILYRVHQYFFCRDSNEFKDRISQLSTQQEHGSSSLPVISLHGVKPVDFDAFLSILYPLNFKTLEEHSSEEWSSILDLSTRWDFTSIRDLAIRYLKLMPLTSNQRLILGRKYAVEQWILPALQELCERPLPLTLDEARLMDFEDVVLIGSVRETIRSHLLTVENAGIRDCIESWRSGKPWQRPAKAPPAANGPEPVFTLKDPIPQPNPFWGFAPRRESAKLDGAANGTEPAHTPEDPTLQPNPFWGFAPRKESAKLDGAANGTEPAHTPEHPIPQPSLRWGGSFGVTAGKKKKKGK